MKFISWNVNGIRAALKKGLREFLLGADADIVCLQETRARPEQVALDLPGYRAYWNAAERKGYSGVLMLARREPLSVRPGMGHVDHDREGRVLTLEYADFFVTTVYTPNSRRGLTRLAYRTVEWDAAFLAFVKQIERRKPVIVCGDLNVAHKEIDLADPRGNRRNAGFTDEERAGFDRIVAAGFVDTFREFERGGGHYTWWSYWGNARAKNHGWRIDYFCISKALRPRLESAAILPHVMGSDHCPIVMELA
jgi:exodeoxyribonuclease-3